MAKMTFDERLASLGTLSSKDRSRTIDELDDLAMLRDAIHDLAWQQEWVDSLENDSDIPQTSLSDLQLLQHTVMGLGTLSEGMKRSGQKIGDILVNLTRSESGIESLWEALADTECPLKRQVVAYTLGLLANKGHTEVQPLAGAMLLQLVEDKDWRVRFFATDLLGAIGDPVHLSILAKRLHDEAYPVHCAAARGLGRINTCEAAQELVKALEIENSSHGQIQDSLVFLGPIALQPILQSLETTRSSETKLALLTALSYLGDPESFQVFQEALNSGDARYRAAAAQGLAALGYPGALEILISLLKDTPFVQPTAVNGLVSNVLWGRVSRQIILDSIRQYVTSPLGYQQEAVEYLRTGEVAFDNWQPPPQQYTAFVYQLEFNTIVADEINEVLDEPAGSDLSFDLRYGVRGSSRRVWGEAVRRSYHALPLHFSLDKHEVTALLYHLDAEDPVLGEKLRSHLKSRYSRVRIPYDLFLSLAELAGNSGLAIDTATASVVRSYIEISQHDGQVQE